MINLRAPLFRRPPALAFALFWFAGVGVTELAAQSLGGAGTLRGIVRDATDAPVPSATVELSNPVTSFSRQTKTGSDGVFTISGIPPNNYRLLVALAGFQTVSTNIAIQTAIPMDLKVRLEIASQQTTVTVEATTDNLVENRATVSNTVDRQLLAALPTSSSDFGLNDAIIYTTAGIAADSNGFFHPLGDHAQVSYVIDGQPVSDQRNKVFSTSIPVNAIQSMEVISGSPPA